MLNKFIINNKADKTKNAHIKILTKNTSLVNFFHLNSVLAFISFLILKLIFTFAAVQHVF